MTEPTSHCPDCGTALPAESPQALCPACLMKQALASRTVVEGGDPAPAVPPLSPEELAESFPGFEILECLGRGGMGVVYKARQKSLDRIVAIKILPPERVGEERFSDRFAIEAATLAKLSHPNIVTVHDFGIADSQLSTRDSQPLYYIVMEFIDGVNLRDLLRDGKLEAKQALAIIPPICDALQYAHDKGIVHRDIKPENLLLDRDGRVKIADFGIASLMGASGEIAGTPPYMAPEQNGANIDHRADIYALGVVLYEMLTGERPGKELIAPSRKVQIDVRLDEVVLRALERKPELRFQQATAMKTRLESIADPDAARWPTQQMPFGYEYRSSKTLFGLPLLHVANGLDPLTGQSRHARGIIAIGSVATGWLAMGGRAYGVIAFGGIAVGVFALGGVAVGMVSVGGLTLALVLALGGMAIAPFALGGLAMGYLAIGGQAMGMHVVDGRHPDTAWLHQSYRVYQKWVLGALGAAWLFLLGAFACISAWAKSQALGHRKPSQSRASNGKPGHLGEWALGLFIGAIAGIPLLLGFTGAEEAMVLCGLALLLSFVLGLMSRRSQSGKFAALASGLALLLLVAFAFKFLLPRPPREPNKSGGKDTAAKLVKNSGSAPKDTSPVIPKIRFQDTSLVEALDFFRKRWPVNYAFDPEVTHAQKDLRISIKWDGVTARQAMTATLDAAGLQMVENPETGVIRIVIRPTGTSRPALTPFGQGMPDTSPVIPKIRFQDTSLVEALDFFRERWPVNYLFAPEVTDAQKDSRISVEWDGVTARQAMTATLDAAGLQMVGNPETGVCKIINKTSFGVVTERELRVDGKTLCQGLDLENGTVVTLSLEEFNRSDHTTDARLYRKYEDWLKAKGVDMFIAAGEKGFGVAGLVKDFKLGALPNGAWDTATEADLNRALEHAVMEGDEVIHGLKIPQNLPQPLTYALRSGDRLGLLQITARLQNPDGVRIRYKLLPGPNGETILHPSFKLVRDRATEIARRYYPDFKGASDGDRFVMRRNLRAYDVHNGSKSGEVSAETQKETGPAADGFRLVLEPLVEAPVSQAFQADGPQILDRPYWKSFVDHRFDPEKRSGVAMYFDFGPAVEERFRKEMLRLLKKEEAR